MAQGAPDGPRKVLGWPTIWIAAAIILTVTIGSGVLLFWIYPPPGSKEALDIIRTAGTLGVGAGGAAALLLHARRQRSTEEANEIARKANEDTRYDAEERRITELQAQANEQLGSEKASVRLGALTLLKRLANSYPKYQQDIVDILCAYLRMPFACPDEFLAGIKVGARVSGNDLIELHEELQVRLTVQRMLAERLRSATDEGAGGRTSGDFLKDISLNLAGATLVDFDLSGCRVKQGDFGRALFMGSAVFNCATLDDSWFVGAHFDGPVDFSGACFEGNAPFAGSTFSVSLWGGANFQAVADFGGVRFGLLTGFSEAEFEGEARFGDACFGGVVSFAKARFAGSFPLRRARCWDKYRDRNV
ncbi:pentapeptide repeat-containing protein [Saccharopolyspora antimicrobica]|nr:pentapeptide repeat-containing protein [Saccharopolyspora antimicrobica]